MDWFGLLLGVLTIGILAAGFIYAALRIGIRFLVRRLASLIFILLCITFITFILGYFAPGDAVIYQLGDHINASRAFANHLYTLYGLKLPWYQQYANFLDRLLHFNLGISWLNENRTVWSIIQGELPPSVELATTGTVLALVLGVYLGIKSAERANTTFDTIVQFFSFVWYLLPIFVIVPLYQVAMIILFQHNLPSLPVEGWGNLETDIAPILIFALGEFAYFVKITRASIVEGLHEDYVRTARAKGLSERVVLYRHVLRNALLNIVSAFGPALGSVVGGVLILEDLFNIPGIGAQSLLSIEGRDYPVVQATVILATVGIALANLLTDITYGLLDPRIKTN
jgi:ABC-type dipeptide/oligopeptide/nickel transport system permease component